MGKRTEQEGQNRLRATCAAVAFFILVFSVYSYSQYSNPKLSLSSEVSHNDPSQEQQEESGQTSVSERTHWTCSSQYLQNLLEIYGNTSKYHRTPQLTFDQALWISTIVQTSAHIATAHTDKPSSPNNDHGFLVWGLGYDSPLWANANCVVRDGQSIGRTVFLENWASWIKKLNLTYPTLEIYHYDQYKETVQTTNEYLKRRTLITLPEPVQNRCWDVVLVDAPQGFSSNVPGRAEATVWAVEMAHRCLTSGEVPNVHIFLHDVNRPVEQKLVDTVLTHEPTPDGVRSTFLGKLKGSFGNLVAFRFTRFGHSLR